MKNLNINTWLLAGAVLVWAILGFCYVALLVIPSLNGDTDLYVYTGDNDVYIDMARSLDLEELVSGLNEYRNIAGPALFSKFAEFISLDYYDYVVFVLNLIALAIALENYRLIFEFLKSSKYPAFVFLMMLNPYIIASLGGISKEIFGLLIFSAFLRYTIERNVAKYAATVLLSIVVRDAFAIGGILLFMLTHLKIKKIYYLVFLSMVLPFALPFGQDDVLLEGQDEQSLGISLWLKDVQAQPFGYVITYIPKLLLSAFADSSPLRFLKSADNIIGICITISVLLSLMLCLWIAYKTWIRKIKCDPTMLNLLYAYSLVAASTVYIHHRYLFPLYPVLIMLAFINGGNSASESVRQRNRLAELAPGIRRT